MKQFFLTFAAVILGGFVLLMIPFIILSAIITASMSETETTLKSGTVLRLDLTEELSDRDLNSPAYRVRNAMNGGSVTHGMNTLRDKLADAAEDDNISALYITGSSVATDFANLRDLRRAIAEFKEASGKPVYYFDSSISNGAEYVATVADSIFLAPEGSALLTGCTASKYYVKRLADKYGLGFDVIKHGKYKSAVEPYFRDNMSDEDREQTLRYINVLWGEIRDSIAAARNIEPASIDNYVDELKGLSGHATAAVEAGLVDRAIYFDEFIELLRKVSGKKDSEKFDVLDIYDYCTTASKTAVLSTSNDKVAIVYAGGQIYDGKSAGDDANIYGDDLAETLRTVRKDTTIKAVVMRVNSPGGSALASDIIWREVKLISEEKPFIVSMGGYAASGGYYISCAANYIFAEPTTLTGSIGVFGMIPNASKLADNAGVSFEIVSTSKNPIVTGIQPVSAPLMAALTGSVENTYKTFVSRVSDGRDMTFEGVDSIGGGHVWTGLDAQKIGLVDQLGNLDDAIDMAVEMAGLGDDYETQDYPKIDDSMAAVMKQFGLSVRAGIGHSLLGSEFDQVEKIKEKMESPTGYVWAICDEVASCN